MPSYSEWLGRKMQNTQKFLDTRPHRDAGHHTEVVKRAATIVIDRRPTGLKVMPASAYTDYVGGVQYRTGTSANDKTPQLAITCAPVSEPPPAVYKVYPSTLTGIGRAPIADCAITQGPTQGADYCIPQRT